MDVLNILKYGLLLSLLMVLLGCDNKPDKPKPEAGTGAAGSVLPAPPETPLVLETEHRYPWMPDYDVRKSLVNRFAPPLGFRRADLDSDWSDWLRHLPLAPEGTPVLYYNGMEKGHAVHDAVVDIDVGEKDLQQCADAVMRLRAEYLYSKGEYGRIHFNYTSGDRVAFSDWARGRKPSVQGNRVSFSAAGSRVDTSYFNFKKYLNSVFNYAGSASLEKELRPVALSAIQVGDVFIKGGFPGHAVIVVDMAQDQAGNKCFLLAQSYMPAQSVHVLKNPKAKGISPWYLLPEGNTLETPEWDFGRDQLRRFP